MTSIRTLLLTCALVLCLAPGAHAATLTIPGDEPPPAIPSIPSRPVSIFVGDTGSLQAKRGAPFQSNPQIAGMFFGINSGPAANYWHLRVKGAPANNVTFGPRDTGGVQQGTNVLDLGGFTAGSPARVDTIMTVVSGGVELFEVKQTVLYVAPELRYRVVWDVKNIDPQNRTIPFVFGTSADLFIESDASNGLFIDGPSRFIGGTNAMSRVTGGLQEVTTSQLPGEAVAKPVARWASYEEGDPFYTTTRLGAADAFVNTINPLNMDNGVGVSFDDRATTGLAPGQTARYEVIWHLARPTLLTASPQVAKKELPSSHTVTLSLTDTNFAPVAGATVRYRRTGVNATGVLSTTTSASGNADIVSSGTTPGTDTLLAWIDGNGDSVQDAGEQAASASIRWIADNHFAGPPTVTPPAGVTPTVLANPENVEAPTFQFNGVQSESAGFTACSFDQRAGFNLNLPVSATLQPGGGAISGAQLFLLDPTRSNPDDLGTPLPVGALADGTAQQVGNVYSFTVPCVVRGAMWLQFTLTEGVNSQTFRVPIGGLVLIDPQGVVYDGARYDEEVARGSTPEKARATAAIAGATVRLQRQGVGGFVTVLSGDPGIKPNVNPQITPASGRFQWDVSAGTYRVLVGAPGCKDAIGGPVDIPPPALDLHVRLDCWSVSGGGGAAAGGPAGVAADTSRPVLSMLRVTPKRFRVGRSTVVKGASPQGGRMTFRLSERATVVLAIERKEIGRRVGASCRKPGPSNRTHKTCTRYVVAGTFARNNLAAGSNSVAFSGRIGTTALAVGRYRVAAVATDAGGNAGVPRQAPFRIVRR